MREVLNKLERDVCAHRAHKPAIKRSSLIYILASKPDMDFPIIQLAPRDVHLTTPTSGCSWQFTSGIGLWFLLPTRRRLSIQARHHLRRRSGARSQLDLTQQQHQERPDQVAEPEHDNHRRHHDAGEDGRGAAEGGDDALARRGRRLSLMPMAKTLAGPNTAGGRGMPSSSSSTSSSWCLRLRDGDGPWWWPWWCCCCYCARKASR
ncbi:hypothetical protein F4780DRAFT_750242 [Xylariomycetidae sp. FL0641]|nr:hypothetical protein F4780DRAFT_750242 [Xylariomycetidae sp. FL0641]